MGYQDQVIQSAIHFMAEAKINALGELVLRELASPSGSTYEALVATWQHSTRRHFDQQMTAAEVTGEPGPAPASEMRAVAEAIWKNQPLLPLSPKRRNEG